MVRNSERLQKWGCKLIFIWKNSRKILVKLKGKGNYGDKCSKDPNKNVLGRAL
jgi:hypothetical protein